MTAQSALSNTYPQGQCTYYASQRYHDLTGIYVPWAADAHNWSGFAPLYGGWKVSSAPIVPSIMVLQAGVQGSDYPYGHVGVVESVAGKTFTVSNLNWGSTPSQVTSVTFYVGPGVSFVYALDSNNNPIGATSGGVKAFVNGLVSGDKVAISLSPTADVTTLLWTLDQLLEVKNPFTGINAAQDTFAGFSITDPVSWLEGFGGNVVDDMTAALIRLIFLIAGCVVMLKVLSHFIDFGAISGAVSSSAELAAVL